MGSLGNMRIWKESYKIVARNRRHFFLLTLSLILPTSCIITAFSFWILPTDTFSYSSYTAATIPSPFHFLLLAITSLFLSLPGTASLVYSTYHLYVLACMQNHPCDEEAHVNEEDPKSIKLVDNLTIPQTLVTLPHTLPRLALSLLFLLLGFYPLFVLSLFLLNTNNAFLLLDYNVAPPHHMLLRGHVLFSSFTFFCKATSILAYFLLVLSCTLSFQFYARCSLGPVVAILEPRRMNLFSYAGCQCHLNVMNRSDFLSKQQHGKLFFLVLVDFAVGASLLLLLQYCHSSSHLGLSSRIAIAAFFNILRSFYQVYSSVVTTMMYISCKLHYKEPLAMVNQFHTMGYKEVKPFKYILN